MPLLTWAGLRYVGVIVVLADTAGLIARFASWIWGQVRYRAVDPRDLRGAGIPEVHRRPYALADADGEPIFVCRVDDERLAHRGRVDLLEDVLEATRGMHSAGGYKGRQSRIGTDFKCLEGRVQSTMVPNTRLLTLSPVKIAGGYLVFGVIWILISDRIVLLITESQTQSAQIQTFKGWLFVIGSAVLIFGLTQTRERQIKSSQDRLNRATQELQVLHRVFRHNIRNDLNVVQGYIGMALDSIDENNIQDWLRTATDSTRRITDMSEKLRIIEETDIRPRDTGSVDIVDIIRRERDEFESSHPTITIETDLPERARISGDQSLRYVIRELFENAFEHHHLPEDQRQISVSVDQSITSVTIQISDNGPGIPGDELAAMRSEEESQLSHISGVGLWVVKWLCGSSGGDVSFQTGTGERTLVTIEFPVVSPIEGLADQDWTGDQVQAVA